MAGGAEILFYGKIEKFTSLVDERSNSPEGGMVGNIYIFWFLEVNLFEENNKRTLRVWIVLLCCQLQPRCCLCVVFLLHALTRVVYATEAGLTGLRLWPSACPFSAGFPTPTFGTT